MMECCNIENYHLDQRDQTPLSERTQRRPLVEPDELTLYYPYMELNSAWCISYWFYKSQEITDRVEIL